MKIAVCQKTSFIVEKDRLVCAGLCHRLEKFGNSSLGQEKLKNFLVIMDAIGANNGSILSLIGLKLKVVSPWAKEYQINHKFEVKRGPKSVIGLKPSENPWVKMNLMTEIIEKRTGS